MTAPDRHTLAKKLEYLRQNLEMLGHYSMLSGNELEENSEKRFAAERLLQTAIETSIDCSRLIVAVEGLRRLRDERDAFLILAEHGIISNELAQNLLKAKGFRNILVYDYVAIDTELVAKYLNADIKDLLEFAKKMANWLSEQKDE